MTVGVFMLFISVAINLKSFSYVRKLLLSFCLVLCNYAEIELALRLCSARTNCNPASVSKGELKNVSILGPVRPASQVEISLTDARSIGVTALVRESGDIEGTEGCTLVGPCGEVVLTKGVIAAKRHIHITPENAAEFGVSDKQIVNVKIETEDRSLIFGDVVCRVSEKFAPAMHIDTDESNAAACKGVVYGEILA